MRTIKINPGEPLGEIEFGEMVGQERKIRIAGLDVRVNAEHLQSLFGYGGEWRIHSMSCSVTRDDVLHASRRFAQLVRDGSGASIPVRRVGAGPTDKSCKVAVNGVVHPFAIDESGKRQRNSHTLTVPASLLVQVPGQMYMPRWALMKTIRERIYENQYWPLGIDGGVWLNQESVQKDFWDPMLTKVDLIQAAAAVSAGAAVKRIEERQARYAVYRAGAADRANAEAAEKVAAKAEAERKRQASQIRKEKLETVSDANVSWTEWDEKTRSKFTRVETDCVIRFAGERVYITLKDGREIIKMRYSIDFSQQRGLEGALQA